MGHEPIVEMGACVFQSTDPTPSGDGDVNSDRVVNLQDLSVLLANIGTVGNATPAQGDLNGDQDVYISDLALLLANFGATCDTDADGDIDLQDLATLLAHFSEICP